MPSHNNTLQTIPPELRNKIYHTLAATSTRVILGRKFLASHSLGEDAGILPVRFANAAALEPLSMACRQFNFESAILLSTDVNPPNYHFVVNNFDLDQVDFFRRFMNCPMNCPRDFQFKFQFDSGVLESALELERRVTLEPEPGGIFGCKIAKFGLVFALSRDKKVFSGDGNGRGNGGSSGAGDADKAMTESQARETVQVLRRIRLAVNLNNVLARSSTIADICIRFEALLDAYVRRENGGVSNVWRFDGLPDAHPLRAKADERNEAEKRRKAEQMEAERLEEALLVKVRLEIWKSTEAAELAEDEHASADETASSNGVSSAVWDSGSDSDAGVELPPHYIPS